MLELSYTNLRHLIIFVQIHPYWKIIFMETRNCVKKHTTIYLLTTRTFFMNHEHKIYMVYKNCNFLDKNQKSDKEAFLKNSFLHSCQKFNKNFTSSCYQNIKSFSVLLVFTLLFDFVL